MRRISEVRAFLEAHSMSPEQFAKLAGVSNMTVRRLLKKESSAAVPAKYRVQFESVVLTRAIDGARVVSALEEASQKNVDLERLRGELISKLKDRQIGAELRVLVETVMQGAFRRGNRKYSALCVGALLYLLNPFDIIPDAMPVMGYLDDLAVLSLAVANLPAQLRQVQKKKSSVE